MIQNNIQIIVSKSKLGKIKIFTRVNHLCGKRDVKKVIILSFRSMFTKRRGFSNLFYSFEFLQCMGELPDFHMRELKANT